MRGLVSVGGALVIAMAVSSTAWAEEGGTGWCEPACRYVASEVLARGAGWLGESDRVRLGQLARAGSSDTSGPAKRTAVYAFANTLVHVRLPAILRGAGRDAAAAQVERLPTVRDAASATAARQALGRLQATSPHQAIRATADMLVAFSAATGFDLNTSLDATAAALGIMGLPPCCMAHPCDLLWGCRCDC